MSKEEINKILVEAEGGCWHEFPKDARHMSAFGRTFWERDGIMGAQIANCVKCGAGGMFGIDNPDFSKWENFSRLLKIVRKQSILNISFFINKSLRWWLAENIEIDNIPTLASEAIAQLIGEKK